MVTDEEMLLLVKSKIEIRNIQVFVFNFVKEINLPIFLHEFFDIMNPS
jgi:hypothetical protein